MHSNSAVSCGPFDLIETIGRGGMAQVWRGIHRSQNPNQQVPVAVKVITGAKAADPEYIERFEREVQAVAALDHPGIVTVFDYGVVSELAAQSDLQLTAGSPYLAMELARGGTLRERPLIRDWPSLRVFILDILDALAYAHARDVIHRDLKPENILCQIDGSRLSFKLSDFGIAHAGDADLATDTQSYDGASAGTPYYMPPEQITGEWRDFGPWTDLYALGCLIYELICGRRPYEESNFIRLANLHLHEPFPRLEPRFVVPEELDGFLQRLVAKAPHQRFQRAADAALALDKLPTPEATTGVGSLLSERTPLPEHIDVGAETLTPTEALSQGHELSGDAVADDAPTLVDLAVFDKTETFVTQNLVTLGQTFERGMPARGDEEGEAATSNLLEEDPVEVARELPRSWRRDAPKTASDQLVGVGLGLFGLRSIPFVDRDAQRDAIWQVLRQVGADPKVRVINLRGGLGTGKSRLAEWMSRRAHELGAAMVLKASHSRQAGPSDGIRRMLENFFATWSLDRSQTYKRVYSVLAGRLGGEQRLSVKQLEELAGGLTELTRPMAPTRSDDEPHFQITNVADRHVWLTRFLDLLAANRPVILWVDDLPWGEETLGFLEHLVALDKPLAVLVLATSREDALAEHFEVEARISALEAHERATSIEVGALAAGDHAELIRRTLRLDASLSRRVEEHTAGNPLFALQLIGDWVNRGILEVGREGFSLRSGAASMLPRDIHDLWIQRVQKLLDEFAPERRRALQSALEIAAILGPYVDGAEWDAACQQAGVEASYELARRLVELGLARRERNGASFVHSMLAESLRQGARRNGRAPEHHLACVRAVEALYPDRPLETARRRALHLIGAGRLHEALAPLKDAIHYCYDREDYHTGLYLLDKRRELADELELGDEDRRRVENLWMRAQFELPRGDTDEAVALAERAAEIAARHDWHVDVGHALVVKARVLRDRTEYHETLEVLARAGAELERVDDTLGLLFVRFSQGFVQIRLGKPALARQLFDEALDYAREIDDLGRVAQIVSQIGYAWFAEYDFERAREVLLEGFELSERSGSQTSTAACARHLGEIARFQGEWDTARRYYERALQIESVRGSKNALLDQLNLVMASIGDTSFAQARAGLDGLRDKFLEKDLRFGLPVVDVSCMAVAAGLRDASAFDSALQRAEELLKGPSGLDRDIQWLLERTEAQCKAAGWSRRAERLRDLRPEPSEGD